MGSLPSIREEEGEEADVEMVEESDQMQPAATE